MPVKTAFLIAALVAVLAGGASAKGAQGAGSAQDYFHGSAYKFIAGRQQEALIEAEEGLSRFPDDAALKTLVSHLRKLKDQKQKDQGSQGSSQGDKGDDKQDQKKDDSQGGGDKDQEKQDQQQPEPEDKDGKDGEKEPQDGGESDKQDGKDSSGQAMAPVKPGEMSKEDAERLLNSIQDDEKKEHRQQQKRYRKRPEVEQDW